MKTVQRVALPAEIIAYLKSSSTVAYLYALNEAIPYVLTKDVERCSVVRHDSCVFSFMTLQEGTEGYLHISKKYSYSETMWSQLAEATIPTPGCDRYHVGSYYTFMTIIDGALVTSFKSTDHDPRLDNDGWK